MSPSSTLLQLGLYLLLCIIFFFLSQSNTYLINERKCKVIEIGVGNDHTSLQPAFSPMVGHSHVQPLQDRGEMSCLFAFLCYLFLTCSLEI